MGFSMKKIAKKVGEKVEPGTAPASSGGRGIRGMMARALSKVSSQSKGPGAGMAGKAIEAKKGGMIKKKSASDMAGRALKRTTADAKGRAMKKGK